MGVSWSPAYATHIPEIDAQHQKLFLLLNQLDEAFYRGDTRDGTLRILRELLSYTESHFSYEEQLFSGAGYPESEHHIQEHLAFADRIREMQRKLDNHSLMVGMELILFLGEWLTHHVLVSDQKYVRFLNS